MFWGGRTIEQNYHVSHVEQRFALDLTIKKEGLTHTGDGQRNEDYYCFGVPLVSPAEGIVLEAIDGVPDNTPGALNPMAATGNRLVIDHGNDEYSVLAHLRNGSLQVAVGDRVQAGEHVGDCGNTGNSTEPHLHYQLQNGPVFGVADALPAQFSNYIADNQLVARGEPKQGQRIRPGDIL